MKSTIYLIIIIISIPIFSCENFDEINTNPDASVTTTASMLATNLLLEITRNDISSEKGFMANHMFSKYICWSEFQQSEQYNYFGRTGFDLEVLTNVQKMIENSFEGTDRNSYTALGHFIRAWRFFNITMAVGDIPYQQALQGESEGIIKPGYDTQKAIFIGILNELEEADRLFSEGTAFKGDIVYGGDPEQWRKLVNSFALKVLINLYKKTNDADLNVIEKFNEIINTKPVFENNDDQFDLEYSDQANQKYPYFKEGNQTVIYPMVTDVLINPLKDMEDYRLFYFAEPSEVELNNGKSESDFEAYKGVNPAIVYSTLSNIAATNDYSDINDRYKELPDCEPVALLSYAETQFIIAEAAVRGWISQDASIYFNEGVRASMEFVNTNAPNNQGFNHGRDITPDYIENYLNAESVSLSGGEEEQIEKIITQKFIANFLHAPRNSYFENRRTGYPEFPINPESNLNVPADKLPVRWMYPQSELDYNTENVNEAISRQFSGNDNVNELMWILK